MANNRRRLVGRVVSNKMDKTVVVSIERRQIHRLYKKVVTVRKRVMAHDESNQLDVGTMVRIVESKPISKRKRWVVESVIAEVKGGIAEDVTVQDELAEMLGEDEPEVTPDDTADASEVVEASVDAAAEAAAAVEEAADEADDEDAEAQAVGEAEDVEADEDESSDGEDDDAEATT
ncbi:MAG: 30S ribosomal protein S17 [Chloroflexi bacterium]|nr:MAG: 30S ribosomal protein S17 [Phototrophicales bacterium]RMF82418.1 MAG: 30S ribosomal protein S17 [Chloroflexota bacterium]